MTIRVQTDCKSCNTAPWPGVSPSWKPVGNEPGIQDWARNLPVRRCQNCGRYWDTPYDPYDGTYSASSHPVADQLSDLLRSGAGADALFAFLESQEGPQDDSFTVVQSYLIGASFDFGEVLRDLIARLPAGGGEAVVWPLRLPDAVLSGESGRLAWLAALRDVYVPPLLRTSLHTLRAALD